MFLILKIIFNLLNIFYPKRLSILTQKLSLTAKIYPTNFYLTPKIIVLPHSILLVSQKIKKNISSPHHRPMSYPSTPHQIRQNICHHLFICWLEGLVGSYIFLFHSRILLTNEIHWLWSPDPFQPMRTV